MLIEMIDDKHLKVELDSLDLLSLNIHRSSFANRDANACRALKSILKNAYEQTGFDIFRTKLTVEIFPTYNEGCIILFTRNSGRRFKASTLKRPCVYRFEDVNSLLDCLQLLSGYAVSGIGAVYSFNNKFYLCLNKKFILSKAISLLFSEFSAIPDKISPLFLKEHGKTVCEQIPIL